jgi:hypothetical protein
MSFEAQDAVMKLRLPRTLKRSMHGPVKGLLNALAYGFNDRLADTDPGYLDEEGFFRVGQAKLSGWSGYSKSFISKVTSHAEEAGLIAVRHTEWGNRYKLLFYRTLEQEIAEAHAAEEEERKWVHRA